MVLSKPVSYKYHNKRKSPINGLFTPFMKLCLLFKLPICYITSCVWVSVLLSETASFRLFLLIIFCFQNFRYHSGISVPTDSMTLMRGMCKDFLSFLHLYNHYLFTRQNFSSNYLLNSFLLSSSWVLIILLIDNSTLNNWLLVRFPVRTGINFACHFHLTDI